MKFIAHRDRKGADVFSSMTDGRIASNPPPYYYILTRRGDTNATVSATFVSD